MNGWFTRKQAIVDLVVSAGAACFAWFWFGEVLGRGGYLLLVSTMFALAQVVRFVNAQRATLEWANLQEAGLPEKRAKIVVQRGDGYRDAAVIEEVVDDDRDETEIARRRSSARRSIGVVFGGAALATLVPGFLYGAWVVPIVFGVLASMLGLFYATMHTMQRRQRRVADDAFARQRVAVNPPKARVGVDFGVPSAEIEEEESAGLAEQSDAKH